MDPCGCRVPIPGQIRPHRRCWGVIFRMALVKGYRFHEQVSSVLFFTVFFEGERHDLSKTGGFGRKMAPPQVERARPKSASEKWKNPVFFNFLTSIFWFATSFFAVPQVAGPGGGFLSFWTRFRTDFRRFVIAETLVFSVFLFSACLTASFKTSKNLVNYAVLCYGVNENIVNTSVFWRWLKKHCKLQCFWPPDPQKPWYLQWFLLLTAQKHCK